MTAVTPKSSKTQCSPPLEDVLGLYFLGLDSMECLLDDPALGKYLVKSFKGENASNEEIYNKLMAIFPDVGCPLEQSSVNKMASYVDVPFYKMLFRIKMSIF
jgi:hypothetical protein